MDKTIGDTAKDLVYQQKERLEATMKRKMRYLIHLKIYHSTPISKKKSRFFKFQQIPGKYLQISSRNRQKLKNLNKQEK